MAEFIDFLERSLDKFQDLQFDFKAVSKKLFQNFETVLDNLNKPVAVRKIMIRMLVCIR